MRPIRSMPVYCCNVMHKEVGLPYEIFCRVSASDALNLPVPWVCPNFN